MKVHSNVLDLFSGTGSATRPFVDCGRHSVVHVDIQPPAEIRCDVRKLPRWVREYPWDFVWASPPCEGFSIAGVPWHWRGFRPDHVARRAISLFRWTLDFVTGLDAEWLIENPVGLAREYNFGVTETVYYCSYGGVSKKPTDLWGNRRFGLERPCGPHESAPSGSKRGIQGYARGDPRRGMVPRLLAEAVHRAVCPEPTP